MGVFTLKINKERKFGLDILRAFAIIFVIIEHGSVFLPKEFLPVYELFIFDGVSVFFVLSGFLIGGILIKLFEDNNGKISLKLLSDFWMRRWFRTLPNYYLVLLVLAALNYFFIADFKLWKLKRYVVFSQNITEAHPSFFGEAWSLSVEEWFYLIIPVILAFCIWILKIRPKQSVIIVAVVIITAITAFRYNKHLEIDITRFKDWDLLFRKLVITRLDSLMYGIIGAWIHFYAFEKWVRYKNVLFAVGITFFLFSKYYAPDINGVYFKVFSFSLLSLATFLMLPFLSVLKSGGGIFHKPVTYLSLISYSMYLLNLNVIQIWIINRIDWKSFIQGEFLINIITYFLYWILVIFLSILLYKYFELPMMGLRDKKLKIK